MSDDIDTYCKVFLQGVDPSEAGEKISSLLGEETREHLWRISHAEVEVRRNPDAGAAADFIGWPTVIEVETEPDTPGDSVVALVSGILTTLWESGVPAVAACDFEEMLPWRGGIDRFGGPSTSVH
ncbi:hypothetical protein ABZ892_14220 [Streptomyces sp. NPDC046924]|uniref:hypothetical protein n=1 Tax=Streptomyces sp. NPDC046924 TaxID=3155136 RepID=UPI00340ECFB5